MKEERKGIDVEKLGAEGAVNDLAALAGGVGDLNGDEARTGKKGRRKKRKAEDDAGGPAKRANTTQ